MGLYETLGLTPAATQEEIKEAFRKLAQELHPDKTGGDEKKAERFKKVTAAYSILSDPEKRAEYDALGRESARSTKSARDQARATADYVREWARRYGGFTGDPFEDTFGTSGARYRAAYGGFGELRAETTATEEEARAGFTRVLTVMISVDGEREEVDVTCNFPAHTRTGSQTFGFVQDGKRGTLRVHVTVRGRSKPVRVVVALTFIDALKGVIREVSWPDGQSWQVGIGAGTKDGQVVKTQGREVEIKVVYPKRYDQSTMILIEKLDEHLKKSGAYEDDPDL